MAPGRGSPRQCTSTSTRRRQLPGEEVDVDAGAAVDVWRVLPGEHPDPHGVGAYNCGNRRAEVLRLRP